MKMLEVVKLEMKRGLVYRVDTLINLIYPVIRFLVHYSLWIYIYENLTDAESLFGYNKNQMVTYFLCAYVISVIIKSDATDLGKQIRDGSIEKYMIRPFTFLTYKLSQNLGSRIIPIICLLPFLLIGGLLLQKNIELHLTAMNILYLLIAVTIGFIINFYIDFIIGMSALIFDEVWAINASVNHIKRFVSGEFIPLSVLPAVVFNFVSFSPFYFIIYLPAKISVSSNADHEILLKLLVGVGWIIVLATMVSLIWKVLLRRYMTFGG
ncbi:ABC-2 family transporter protein [Paenibacillus sp. F411]|uniref:ABC transporter permease n=1 Tax=Paenibacillus sp. F411 TaxID=2820239 RepID=UPI001AAF70D0|nr:ABC-2 family transporter protein [Paenibacillus sp. F411]MBO2942628.1 ABC-2 family transporter protein [Paenibacillus sp. F411]